MYTTQIKAVERIREYLDKMNLVMLGIEYRKGKRIAVNTSEGTMVFQFGHEFNRVE
jgi:hypothetical protein